LKERIGNIYIVTEY